MIKHKHSDINAFKIFVNENKSKFKRKYKNDKEMNVSISIQQLWNKMRKSCTDEYFYYIQKYKEQCYSDIIFMKPCQETIQTDQSDLLAKKIRNNWHTLNIM